MAHLGSEGDLDSLSQSVNTKKHLCASFVAKDYLLARRHRAHLGGGRPLARQLASYLGRIPANKSLHCSLLLFKLPSRQKTERSRVARRTWSALDPFTHKVNVTTSNQRTRGEVYSHIQVTQFESDYTIHHQSSFDHSHALKVRKEVEAVPRSCPSSDLHLMATAHSCK